MILEEGVQEIGWPQVPSLVGVFNDCTGFTGTLSIPSTVTYIADEAFGNCTNFDRIEILATTAPTMPTNNPFPLVAPSDSQIHVPTAAVISATPAAGEYPQTINGYTVVNDL